MGRRKYICLIGLALSIAGVKCGSDGIPPATLEQIRQAHARWLTVDGRSDANVSARLLSRMKAGGLDAAFFSVSARRRDTPSDETWNDPTRILNGIRLVRKALEGVPRLGGFARAAEDAYRFEKEGRRSAFIRLDDVSAIGADLSLLSVFYAEGVRCLALCGEADNAVCDSALDRADPEDRGLSDFGRRVVAECDRLGLIIDLDNCSERSFFDVLTACGSAPIVSGTAARALRDHPANLTDEMIRVVGRKGGVVLITFVPGRLVTGGPAAGTADIVDHIERVKKIAGIDAVGIGTSFGNGGGVAGCRNEGEALNFTLELLRRGFAEADVEAIWGGNLMRVVKQARVAAGRGKGTSRE